MPPGGAPPGAPPGGPAGYGPPGAPAGGLPGQQPQQFGQPGQAGYTATPGKQGKGFKYAIIGCGCLLVLGIAIAVFLFAFGGLAYFGLSSHSSKSSSNPSSSSGGGGGVCADAIKCCKMVSAGVPAAAAACDNLKGVPTTACSQALDGYQKALKAQGKTCP